MEEASWGNVNRHSSLGTLKWETQRPLPLAMERCVEAFKYQRYIAVEAATICLQVSVNYFPLYMIQSKIYKIIIKKQSIMDFSSCCLWLPRILYYPTISNNCVFFPRGKWILEQMKDELQYYFYPTTSTQMLWSNILHHSSLSSLSTDIGIWHLGIPA